MDGVPYPIDGEGWRDRVKGMATEFTGTFPGDDFESRYLVACIRIDGTVASIAMRASSEAFEQNRALYKWLLSRVDLVETAAVVQRTPAFAASAAASLDVDDLPETPPVYGMSLTGRIGRLRGLAYSFPVMAPMALVGILAAVVMPKNPVMGGAMFLLALVVTAWLSVRLLVLRLHDMNVSGKWVLGFFGLLLAAAVMRKPVMIYAAIGVIWLVIMIVYCFVSGSPDDNNYGPPPGPNTLWVKIGATLFILLQLSAIGGQSKLRNGANGFGLPNAGQSQGRGGSEIGASRVYMPPDGSFMVTVPGMPQETDLPLQARQQIGDTRSIHNYQLIAGERIYIMQTADYGRANLDRAGAMEKMQALIVDHDSTLIEAKPILLNGIIGRDVRVRTSAGTLRGGRYVIVGSHVYIVTVIAPDTVAGAAQVEEFLVSFRLP